MTRDSRLTTPEQPCPALFEGLSASERAELEDALRRYFALVLRIVDEELGLTPESPPDTLKSDV